MAKILDKSPSWVQHKIALVTSLSKDAQEMLLSRSLNARKAESIARLPVNRQREFALQVQKDALSARDVDKIVSMYNSKNIDEEKKDSLLERPALALYGTDDKKGRGLSKEMKEICSLFEEATSIFEAIKSHLLTKDRTDKEKELLLAHCRKIEQSLYEIKELWIFLG